MKLCEPEAESEQQTMICETTMETNKDLGLDRANGCILSLIRHLTKWVDEGFVSSFSITPTEYESGFSCKLRFKSESAFRLQCELDNLPARLKKNLKMEKVVCF